ncbi:MAG: glucose 1-dehydrogenase [Xanthobacteraceae bacterium]|nr:glucose 1-dehydrogenase [Xanthobacteraceae bacterium]
MRGLDGKIAIVTGGGGAIGAATCRRLAAEGARIAVLDVNGDAAQRTADAVAAQHGRAEAFACDISDYDQVQAAIARVVSTLGPVDVLVNNAGWDVFKPFLKTTPAEWQKLIAINLTGALNMHHVVLPGMVERRAGRVVNIASDAARVGSSGEAVYAACKAGLVALSKTLAREHARDGITFNVVCPGPTDTPLFANFLDAAPNREKLQDAFRRSIPLGRIGQPEDLPGAIAFFASDDAVFVTGQVLSVSGGLTMAG